MQLPVGGSARGPSAIRHNRPHNETKRSVYSDLASLMGRAACHTGQTVTWDEIMNSQEKFVPDNLTWNMDLPIRPMAMPGKTKSV